MNILVIPSFFYDHYDATIGSFFLEQAEALRRKGNTVYILYSDTYSVKHLMRWMNYREVNETVKDIPVFRKKSFCPLKHGSGIYGCHEQFATDILELYQQHLADKQIDVIHAHCCAWAGYAAMKLSEQTGIPYVITEHSAVYGLQKGEVGTRYVQAMQDAFRRANAVICVSKALQDLIAPYRVDTLVLGNVIDCERFCLRADASKSEEFRFLTVFYMQSQQQCYNKGIDLLLTAMSEVVKVHPNVRLMIGGGGNGKKYVEDLIAEHNLQDHVTMLGSLSRQAVIDQMQNCDVYVMPSRYETFGVTYAEAMACGKPVIATRNGGPDTFVTETVGKLIDVGDKKQLADAMLDVIANYQQYDARQIHAHIEQQFSMDAIGTQLLNIYKGLK